MSVAQVDDLFSTQGVQLPQASPAAGRDPGSWTLSRLQVVNWGGFSGHHSIDIDRGLTLLTGASGTGKSTLLDAVIGVLMDHTVPFNGASNEGAGRARSRAQRNVLSYVRGKLADTVGEDDTTVAVLRGQDRPTWSAIGLTWTAASGEGFSAFRAYYASTSASADVNLVREYYTAPFDFDLSLLEPFAAGRFNKRDIKNAFASVTPYGDSYTSFIAATSARLGIGDGRDRKALHLLARVQRGGSMTSVDQLFRDFVLSTPTTFERADMALADFDAMRDAYATMDTARRKLDCLSAIVRQHAEMTVAANAVTRNDSYRVFELDSPFALWGDGVRVASLDEQEQRLAARRRELSAIISDATTRNTELREQEAQARADFLAAGGDTIENLSARVAALQGQLVTVRAERVRLDEACSRLGISVGSATDLTRAQASPDLTTQALDQRVADAQEKSGEAWANHREAERELGALEGDIAYYAGRRDLVPRSLATQRAEVASALGLTTDDLPFVAELIDMHDEFEDWRTATELALGGWALNVLVPAAHASAFRRAANPRNWATRLRWQVVDLDTAAPTAPETTRLPGRLRIRTGAFANVVTAELVRQFDLTCVDSVDDLDRVHRGLTITGQTRTGSRGAHGGTSGHKPVIGYSNERLLATLRGDLAQTQARLERLKKDRDRLQTALGQLVQLAPAIATLHSTTWPSVDVARAEGSLSEATEDLEGARSSSDALTTLAERAERLKTQADQAAGQRESAQEEWNKVDVDYGRTLSEKDAVRDREDNLRARIGDMSDEQREHLDGLLADTLVDPLTPANAEAYLGQVRKIVTDSTRSEARTRDNLAEALTKAFTTFQKEWFDGNRGTDPYQDYSSYAVIVDELTSGGLGALADDFRAQVTKWSSEDLLLLQEAFRTSRDEIRARLRPINGVLEGLSFGRDSRRLSIEMTDTPNRDVSEFRRELTDLASGTTTISDSSEAERRFTRISALMSQLDRSNRSTRDALLDVRRHIHVQAIQHNPDPLPNQRFDTLGEQSGGESQELIAFILGAALRYQLGDADASEPRYRTVVLDEAFIKADPQFLGRGISAWQQLGFQLVIGAPVDKFTALEPFTDVVWITRKADGGESAIDRMTRIDDPDAEHPDVDD